MEDHIITLKCFHCGAEKEVVINGDIDFGFQLVDLADKAGMLGIFDLYRGRALVFCNEDCKKNHTTKKGTIKMRAGYSR